MTAAAVSIPDQTRTPEQAVRVRRSWKRRCFEQVRNALAIFGLVFIIYHLCFRVSVISSGSMGPTLSDEGQPGSDWLLSERVTYLFRNPRRWEVVQFETNDHLLVAKRVAGMPSEWISIQDGHVNINGKLAPYPESLKWLKHIPYGNLYRSKAAACGNGYFVLGDDTRDSADSRMDGPVAPKRILSRTWLIVWPPSRIGFVNP